MCSLCGLLGGAEHWTEAHGRPGDFTRADDPGRRRRDRQVRIAAANRMLAFVGLTLSDWQGASYILATRTGKTELVDSVADLWAVAERLIGRLCDPLDPELLARMEQARG
jgi:hypothetical protein